MVRILAILQPRRHGYDMIEESQLTSLQAIEPDNIYYDMVKGTNSSENPSK